jgi:hypothetical protein
MIDLPANLTSEQLGNALAIGLGLFLLLKGAHAAGRFLTRRFPEAWLAIAIATTMLTILVISSAVFVVAQSGLSSLEIVIGVSVFFVIHLVSLGLTTWRSWRQPDAGHADISPTP